MWIRLACSEAICSKILFTGVCEKLFIGRVLTEVIKETSCSKKYLLSRVDNLISAPNFYCCHFNGRAVPWVFSVGVQCMQIRLGSKVA